MGKCKICGNEAEGLFRKVMKFALRDDYNFNYCSSCIKERGGLDG